MRMGQSQASGRGMGLDDVFLKLDFSCCPNVNLLQFKIMGLFSKNKFILADFQEKRVEVTGIFVMIQLPV